MAIIDILDIAPNLTLGADGIWHCSQKEAISFPEDGHQVCLQVEESSFWFDHRNSCIAAAVTNFPPRGNGPIFDIGGGNGFVSLGLMKKGFKCVVVEPGRQGAGNAKRKGVPTVICATTAAAGFRPSKLNAVGLFDVIEHIEDDLSFLQSLRELLNDVGRLYVTVPAYSALWSNEDVAAGHYRRYNRKSIQCLIERAGFHMDYATYIFRPLPLPILLLRALPPRLGLKATARQMAKDHVPASSPSTAVIDWLLKGEVANIGLRNRMSFGSSCLVVASAAKRMRCSTRSITVQVKAAVTQRPWPR